MDVVALSVERQIPIVRFGIFEVIVADIWVTIARPSLNMRKTVPIVRIVIIAPPPSTSGVCG